MKQLLVIILFFLQINSVVSQHKDVSFEYLGREFPNGTFNTFDSKIKGSPYINKSYQKIKFLNQKEVQFSGKYNAYHDLIEVITNTGKKYFSPSKEHPYAVQFLGSNKIYKAFLTTKKKRGFFRILFISKTLTLLVKEKISFTKEVLPQSGYDKYKPAAFKRLKNIIYIKYNDNEIPLKLAARRSKFLKIFGNNSSTIKNYIKKEKLNIKKEKDLIKIFKYYSSLQS